MSLTRQDLLMASAAVAGAFGLQGAEALAKESGYSVIWLRAQSCSECSASLLETICYDSIEGFSEPTPDLDLELEPSLKPQRLDGRSATKPVRNGGKQVLVVEGAIPVGPGDPCYLWPGLTAASGIQTFASGTSHVIAVGACTMRPNRELCKPQAITVQTLLGPSRQVINLPGCPIDPDWLIGTIAYLFKHGSSPELDSNGRPTVLPGSDVWPFRHLNRPEIWHRTVA